MLMRRDDLLTCYSMIVNNKRVECTISEIHGQRHSSETIFSEEFTALKGAKECIEI